jgi:hypothetical protein
MRSLLFIAGVSSVAFLGCSDKELNSPAATTAGQNQKLTDNTYQLTSDEAEVLIAASQSALDRLIEFANAGDGYGVAELIAMKQVSKVPSGTKCLIIDPGFMTHEIRILEGLHSGEAAFVPAEFVIPADQLPHEADEPHASRTAAEAAARDEAAQLAAIEEDAKFRTWTSASGKHTTEAKIISYANGVVTLENRAAKRIKLEATKLSESDREFIDQWRRERRYMQSTNR